MINFPVEKRIALAIMNKLPPHDFINLRKASKKLHNLANEYQSFLGVYYRGPIFIGPNYVNLRNEHVSPEDAMVAYSGFSFQFVRYSNDRESENEETVPITQQMMHFLRSRIWRSNNLDMALYSPEIIQILRPCSIVASIPKVYLENGKYVDWVRSIIVMPSVFALDVTFRHHRGLELFELILNNWMEDKLGNLKSVCPGMNYTFYDVHYRSYDEIFRYFYDHQMKLVENAVAKYIDYSLEGKIIKESLKSDKNEPIPGQIWFQFHIKFKKDGRYAALVLNGRATDRRKECSIEFEFITNTENLEKL